MVHLNMSSERLIQQILIYKFRCKLRKLIISLQISVENLRL